MKKSKQYVLKIVGCMLLVMVCAFIVFTYQDFPARLMAAILGVVITAIITVVLLDGQSKKEQVAKISVRLTKKRNRKVKVKSPSWKVCWGCRSIENRSLQC